MTVWATARVTVRVQDPVVILTPSKGPAEALSVAEARGLRAQLDQAIAACEKGARELRRPAAVDEQLREIGG